MKKLSFNEGLSLATIVNWVWHKQKVQWLDANGKLHTGEAFAFTNDQGEPELRDIDIRFFYLHIKGRTHWFIAVDEAITKVQLGEMVSA